MINDTLGILEGKHKMKLFIEYLLNLKCKNTMCSGERTLLQLSSHPEIFL